MSRDRATTDVHDRFQYGPIRGADGSEVEADYSGTRYTAGTPTAQYKRRLFHPSGIPKKPTLIQAFTDPGEPTEEEELDGTIDPAPMRVEHAPAQVEHVPAQELPAQTPIPRPSHGLVGVRNGVRVRGGGTFTCPACVDQRRYDRSEVHRYLHVLGIRLWALAHIGTYVECHGCRCTFEEVALTQPQGAEAQHLWAARRVMVMMMMADGDLDPEEIRTVQQLYREIGGKPISQGQLVAEARNAEVDGRDLASFLQTIAATLNEAGKQAVLRTAWQVAAADGVLHPDEAKLLGELIRALDPEQVPF